MLFHISEVKHIIVPKLQEISMKSLAENLKDDENLAQYLPDKWDKKLKLDREWFYNILNTVYPGYLE